MHRSLTAWAQDKLRDQFLYTYRPRPDEDKRLKKRLSRELRRVSRLDTCGKGEFVREVSGVVVENSSDGV